MVWSLSILAKFDWLHIVVFFSCVGASLATTKCLLSLMPKVGLVCRPSNDRWSRDIIPLGGGISMYLVASPFLFMVSVDLFIASSIIFVLGIIDDRKSLPAATKLVIQTLAACWFVASPFQAQQSIFFEFGWLGIIVELLSLILLTNSLNLLDNVDGSAAGVCGIALGFLAIMALLESGGGSVALAALALGGACLGFLRYNFPPAKIFMGDAGSLYIGFCLGALYLSLKPLTDSLIINFLILLFIAGTSIFDTSLVWFTRWSISRPFLVGGKDHVAHRLIALGLSERRTLWVLYGVTVVFGGTALGLARGDFTISASAAVVAGACIIFVGLLLGDVSVYHPGDLALRDKKRRKQIMFLYFGVEILLDIMALSIAWVLAWYLRFDNPELSRYLVSSGLVAIPLVIAIKVAVIFFFRLYRGIWWTIETADLIRIAGATLVCSVVIFAIIGLSGMIEIQSRGVLAIDTVLTFLVIAGNRSALRFLRHFSANLISKPKRAILIGPREIEGLLDHNLEYRKMYTLVGTVATEAVNVDLIKKVQELNAEVALIAGDKESDLVVRNLLANSGVGMRRLSLVVE